MISGGPLCLRRSPVKCDLFWQIRRYLVDLVAQQARPVRVPVSAGRSTRSGKTDKDLGRELTFLLFSELDPAGRATEIRDGAGAQEEHVLGI
jgi:hypothetical protein